MERQKRSREGWSEAVSARTIGVLGAGTMGAGIAQLGAQSGARTLLHDPIPEALAKGVERTHRAWDRLAEKGRMSAEDVAGYKERLQTADGFDGLAECDLIIEAAPEKLELKQDMFGTLARDVVSDTCVLATNTSSLSVTAIASAVERPERVVGMHFFNPPPLMKLLEVVAGDASDEASLALARATGEAMDRHVIDAQDVIGFLVNRTNRPFGLEALRLLQERIGDIETIDSVVRLGGGFRMGPFELFDLVGVDLGFEVAKSFYAQSYGEPRWRPNPLTEKLIAAGRLGRKTGRGWFDYPEGGSHREPDPDPPATGDGGGRLLVVAGETAIAGELLGAASAAGFDARAAEDASGEAPWLILDCGHDPHADGPLEGGPQALLVHEGSLAALDTGGGAVGFHTLPPFDATKLVELTRGPNTADVAAERVEELFTTLGKLTAWVADAPGLVLGRLVCQIINEAAFSVGEGLGSVKDIDAGMTLGMNHPRGPLEWADAIGVDHVLAVIDALNDEFREERYRAAPILRRMVSEGSSFHGGS